MTELDKSLNKLFFSIFFTVIVVGSAGVILAVVSKTSPEKPAIVIPDYKDEIAELALGMQEIKTMLQRENSLKAEMRMECSERLNNMVLQAGRLRRAVPNYKVER